MKRCNNCFEIIEDSFAFCPNCGYKEGNPPKDAYFLYPGVVLQGRYIIGEAIGFGGFGITYKAFDSVLGSVIAIKEFYPSGIVSRNPGENEVIIYAKKREQEFVFFRERFIEEARNLAKFNSENNIVNVYEFFEANNTAYIAMEYLEGEGLNKYLHSHNDIVDVEYAVKIGQAIAEALSKLHAVGIIHRDISPDNIYLCNDGNIKLIDFGAARFSRDENKQLTVILKPGFAPPEQYEQVNKQGPWTDIYALGATLYYIMTGQAPEESTNRKINDNLPDANTVNPNIPEQISRVIMKAMAIDINLRFQNTEEFLSALSGKTAVATVAEEKKRKTNKLRLGISLAALIVVGGISGAVYGLFSAVETNTLPDCSITVWYCKDNYKADDFIDESYMNSYQEMMNSAEDKAYATIVSDFQKMYDNVEVNLVGYEKSEYIKKLKSGKDLPNVYEYVDIKQDIGLLPLNKVYDSDEFRNCSVLSKAEEQYGNRNYLPLGFTIPVVFVANDVERDDKKPINASEALHGHEKFVTDERDFEKIYSGGKKQYSSSAFKQFSNKTAKLYGTDSSNYVKIRESMPARYKIAQCDSIEVTYSYTNVWAAIDSNKKENRAAERFLQLMLSDNAQGAMYLESVNESFPVNTSVLSQFVEVNDDFNGFFDYESMDKYKFD